MAKDARLFLVDHMCVLPYGHNVNALLSFQKSLEDNFSHSFCLATKELPDYVEDGANIERVLSYPYDGLVTPAPKKLPKSDKKRGGDDGKGSLVDEIKSLERPSKRLFYTALYEYIRFDLVRRRTAQNWKKVIQRFKIGANDVIFFPSADFFGCIALLDHLRHLAPSSRPKVHFRLIGVMESANYSFRPGRPSFFAEIGSAIHDGIELSLSAETLSYRTFIERIIQTPVTYLPYPLANEQSEIGWHDSKTVTSPGQGREDKGFFRLFPIIQHLNELRPNGAFQFDVQNMRQTDREFRARYSSTLKNVPNMKLRSARLSQREIDAAYRNADILLLPYDPEVYALRGSAVFQEGMAFGRPVVCTSGLGLSDLVLRYGNGFLATSNHSFAEKIDELARKPKPEIVKMIANARQSYSKDFDSGLRTIFEGMGK